MSYCEDDVVHCENRSRVYIMRVCNKECSMLMRADYHVMNDIHKIMRVKNRISKQEDIYE